MGFFSWECKGCSESIKAPYGLGEQQKWQNEAIVMYDGWSRTHQGSYDGYGRLDGHDVGYNGTPEVWHLDCFTHESLVNKTPTFSGGSKGADDQGYFYCSEEVSISPLD